ncbi:MAG: YjbH domain-containing protein [Silicimonas sp.]|nr:YjbH domain-containing protein [Silicimonas sp.]
MGFGAKFSFRTAAIAGAVLLSGLLTASAEPQRLRNGITGIVDMPSAFSGRDADIAASLAFDEDLRAVSLAFQAAPRLETSLSFTSFADIGGGVSLDNLALNVKLRLVDEGPVMPALSVGIDDLFSNSRESAEYVVAGKTLGDSLRVSLGLGWGRLGGYDTAGDVFADRPQGAARRGEFGHLFQGDAAPFAGIEWDTPIEGLTLAAEYSSASSYGAAAPESRFSFAARYRVADGLDLVAYSRNGDTAGLGLTFHANPKKPPHPPDLGNVPVFAEPRPAIGRDITGWPERPEIMTALREATGKALEPSSVRVERFGASARVMRLGVSTPGNTSAPQLVGRTVRVLSQVAPPSVETFEITVFEGGLPGATFRVPRDQVVALADAPARGPASRALTGVAGADPAETWDWRAPQRRGLSWEVSPALSLPLDADGEIDPEAALFGDVRYDLSDSFYVAGTLSFLVAGDRTADPAPPTPTARSDGGSYDRNALRLDRLYGAYSRKMSQTVYGGLTFGILERQYSGLSAEAVWLPDGRDWALGAEVTYARKRAYDDPFGTLDYDALTGFLSLYWDTGYRGVSARVDAGRYIAGDWGTTLTLSRNFPNGWDASLYATLTEDNRDENLKLGASISIPLATFSGAETRRRSTLALGGNYGDAGARVSVPDRLMGRVQDARSQRIDDAWGAFWN